METKISRQLIPVQYCTCRQKAHGRYNLIIATIVPFWLKFRAMFVKVYFFRILVVMRKTTTSGVDKQFVDRRSSRAYDGSLLTQAEIETLLEAARFAPSSYNEQPWRFYYSATKSGREKSLALLAEGNQEWAKDAGVIFFLATKRHLTETGKANRHCDFDAGAAWMSLALAAHLQGLSAHAMGGFDQDRAYTELKINKKEYTIMAAIAIGKPIKEALKTETKTDRKPLSEISVKDII